MKNKDKKILRELAGQYFEISSSPVQNERRKLWRAHNSFKGERPLIYVRNFPHNEIPRLACLCEDPFFRSLEIFFRERLFWHSLNDDSIFEPWVTVNASHKCSGWGVEYNKVYSGGPGGAFKADYPLKKLMDIEKLKLPRHEIDEEKTKNALDAAEDAIGDIIKVSLNRSPVYRMWDGDLSTDLGYLRGIENFMVDMIDNPGWLHCLAGFLSGGVLKVHDEAEAAGDWGLDSHQNQAMPYAGELPDPAPNEHGIPRAKLWGYMAAQEFTGVSPAMHEEFLLRYQMPILEKFGLTAYGCCEDLTNKIDMLRRIPNLRRIAVSPFADLARCAEAIGTDYILSYRPSPADMVSYSFEPERIVNILKKDFEICRQSYFDITLKDIMTIQCDESRLRKWVEITRGVIGDVFGA